MKDLIRFTRMLWVVPEDMFRNDLFTRGSAPDLAQELQKDFNCDVWLLAGGTSIAYSPRGLLDNSGMTIDYEFELSITRPLHRFVDRFVFRGDAELLH